MHEVTSHGEEAAGEDRIPTPKVEDILPIDNETLLEEALNIYRHIMERRIEGADGDFTWVVRQHDIQTQKMALDLIGPLLYDGTLGIAVFMAALYHCTREEQIKHDTLKALEKFRSQLHDPSNPLPLHRLPLGLGNGLAGILKSLILVGNFLKDSSFQKDISTIINRLEPGQIGEDAHLDILGGCAGLLSVLTQLYAQEKSPKVLSLSETCGEHLLIRRVRAASGQQVWDTGMGTAPLTGMGHGSAGIANALLRLYQITGEDRYYHAAGEALHHEDTLYDRERNNWPDLRKNPHLKKALR